MIRLFYAISVVPLQAFRGAPALSPDRRPRHLPALWLRSASLFIDIKLRMVMGKHRLRIFRTGACEEKCPFDVLQVVSEIFPAHLHAAFFNFSTPSVCLAILREKTFLPGGCRQADSPFRRNSRSQRHACRIYLLQPVQFRFQSRCGFLH